MFGHLLSLCDYLTILFVHFRCYLWYSQGCAFVVALFSCLLRIFIFISSYSVYVWHVLAFKVLNRKHRLSPSCTGVPIIQFCPSNLSSFSKIRLSQILVQSTLELACPLAIWHIWWPSFYFGCLDYQYQ